MEDEIFGSHRKWLLLLDDPEFLELLELNDANAGKPWTKRLTELWDKFGRIIVDYRSFDPEEREELLRDGETEGETQMRHFCSALKKNKQPTTQTMEFFGKAFDAILDGRDGKEALMLKRKRGRYVSEAQSFFEKDLAIEVERFRAYMPLCEAISAIAKKFHKSAETIEGYYKKNRKLATSTVAQEPRLLQQMRDELNSEKLREESARIREQIKLRLLSSPKKTWPY
jgi:hypothetical protein